MREPRLGDDIDDFCVRCKRITNHLVVSVVDSKPAKVRCRTCHSDHDYRHEQAPPPKVDLRKQALFNDVLKKVDPAALPVEIAPVDAAPADAAPAEAAPAAALPSAKVVEISAKPKAQGKASK
jgi:hypothetical protein